MSSQSPASVLYDSNGNALAVQNATAIPANTPAILFAGSDGTNSRYALMSAAGATLAGQASTNFTVQSNSTITASGSTTITNSFFGSQEVNIVVNVTASPTGTTPTLQYTIQELDPGNGTTVYGNSATTSSITATGVFTATINITTSSAIKVSWTVGGTTPSFTGVYATVTTKSTPATQTINGTVTATNPSVGTDGAAALTSDTQVGGKVTTAAPTYTTGNLNALSLTTAGGLRVDGVYPVTTTTANSPDAVVAGGYVTTAAPAYTTGQLNALSLDTAGNLRVSAITNKAATSTTTNVAASVTNTNLLASNATRILATLYNDSSSIVFIKLGTTASATSFSIKLHPNSYWEVPTDYTGNIDAIWNTAAGNMRVTELTP
jgi:hypothetical protein